ncbi:MAG: PepSY domain-containing protein [Acidobacteria bacterium]|nr:PepSY domain-containing protein [Acidobacteriota bacterium]
MTRASFARIHKWIAVSCALFFVAWLVSGIAMVLPSEASAKSADNPAPDFRQVRVTIPQAIAVLEAGRAKPLRISEIRAAARGQDVIYEFTLRNGQTLAVNAGSGASLEVTRDEAERNALAASGKGAQIASTALLTERESGYWGPLPAYRVALRDDRIVYVAAGTGKVDSISTPLSRLRAWLGGLHTFEPLRAAISGAGTKALLVISSVAGVAVVLTGLYLALPPAWLRKKHA